MKSKKILIAILFFSFILFRASFAENDPYIDKTKYPDIVAPSKDPAINKLADLLQNFGCLQEDFGTTYDASDIAIVKNFQKVNGLSENGEIHADTWKALSSTSSKKCTGTGADSNSKTASNVTSTSSSDASTDYYVNVSSFDGTEGKKTPFSNTTTGSISTVFNYLLTLMAVAIVVLVIFRVLQGAVIKGTLDNIYGQMKGKAMISNAGKALIVFILIYAVLAFINPDLVNWTLDTSYKADLSKSPYSNTGGGGGSCPADPYGGKSLREMIIFNEAKVNYVYLDTATPPLPSIGVGFNLKRNGAKASLIKAGVSEAKATQLVSATKEDKSLTLDDATIYKLLDQDIQDKKTEAINYFKKENIDFNSLPQNVQNVIIDMMFNVGISGFDEFLKMKAGIKAKDWSKASREIIDSDYCKQVKGRCYRNAALMSPDCGGALNNNTNTSPSGSLAGQSTTKKRSVCGLLNTVNKSNMVDIRTYLKGSVECIESGTNPDICKIDKDVAERLKKMDTSYYAKYKIHLKVVSAYRSDDYQAKICQGGRTSKNLKCYNACKNGGPTGSNHSLGLAVDLSSENTGCQKSAKTCSSDKWKSLVEYGNEAGMKNNYTGGGEWGHMSPSGW